MAVLLLRFEFHDLASSAMQNRQVAEAELFGRGMKFRYRRRHRFVVGFCIDGRRDAEIDMIGESGLFATVQPSTNEEPQMPISISMIVLSSQLAVPVADGVPKLDIARSCKLDIAATAGLTVDQSVKSCMNDEQKAKRQLAGQWLKFPAPSRASCVSQESIGGVPSYVSLQTCLQMGQWAR